MAGDRMPYSRLTLGKWIGALFANRQTERTLKIAFVLLLIARAAYMVLIASGHEVDRRARGEDVKINPVVDRRLGA